jgi:hypothetical protein
VQDADITDGNAFLNDVEVDLDMLCMLVLNTVGGEVDCVDVVTVDISLGAQSGGDVLALRAPRDQIVTEKHSVARGGLVCIWATLPFCIRVDCQLGGGSRAS